MDNFNEKGRATSPDSTDRHNYTCSVPLCLRKCKQYNFKAFQLKYYKCMFLSAPKNPMSLF